MTSRLFEAVSVDLGYLNGTHYLVLMYKYSGWPLVKPLKKLYTASVTSTLEDCVVFRLWKTCQSQVGWWPSILARFCQLVYGTRHHA